MNKQNGSAIPDEHKIEELLAKIQPVPGKKFHEKMKRFPWRIEPVLPKTPVIKAYMKLTVAAALLLAIASLVISPQGRAWAQEVARFFTRINSNTIQLPDGQLEWMNGIDEQYELPLMPVFVPEVSPEMAAISGCETPPESLSYRCQVVLAESKLGFDLKELPEKPNDWEFKSLYFDTGLQIAVISYDLDVRRTDYTSSSSLVLRQGAGNFPNIDGYGSPWDVVPANKVEPVLIGAYKGEYVKGRFSLPSGSDTLVWSEEFKEQRLAWSNGTRWFSIEFWPNLNVAGTMGRDQLIQLAEGLVDSPIETVEPLNPDHLPSVSDAEKISKLDLKAPTLLPLNTDFSYARYLPDEQQVRLIYGMNEELIIREWKGDPVEFKKPLGAYEFTCEMVNVSYEEAFYCFLEGPNPRSFMWWRKNGLNYRMDFDFLSGGHVNKEKMILIAESMQDIDDFRKKSGKGYEWIVMYEQALALDTKKFSKAPTGWVFANFWGDAQAQCIDLIYTAAAGQGTLLVNQCKTDKRSDISIYPSSSIERVRIGNAKGYYIAGGFVMTEAGKQAWDSTSPPKQLYWQADGLWMQIALYGEEALLSDKEDLISIAESLH